MHEARIVADLVAAADAAAHRAGARRVVRVRLWVGALAHLTAPGLRDRWPVAARGTASDGAELDVESSADVDDPRATSVRLVSVDVEA